MILIKRNLKIFPLLVKFLISLFLILFISAHIDFRHAFSKLTHASIPYLLAGLILYPAGLVICAIKWKYLASALGIRSSLKPMVSLYFIGTFFNLFLQPTSLGGDITRALYLAPDRAGKRMSFLSVIVERGTGVLSMTLLASIAMLSPYGAGLPALLRFGFPVACITGAVALWFFPVVIRNTRTRIRRLVYEDLIVFWKHPKIGIVAVLYSLLFHCILVLIHICIAKALSLQIPAAFHFVTESLASLASLLPSIGGIGVRDAAYIYLLNQIEINMSDGLLFSLMWFLTIAVSSVIGCIFYLVRGLTPGVITTTAIKKESLNGA